MTEQRSITTTGEEIVLDEATLQGFKTSLRGELLRPSETGYEAARQIWNGMVDKRPA